MIDPAPIFPPLLNGHGIAADENPQDWACAQTDNGKLGAGDLVWSNANNKLHFALILEPEVQRARCAEMMYVAMVAIGDAIGALVPPEIAVTYQWPNIVQMNDGQIGLVDLIVSDYENDDIPLWIVLCVNIQLTPDFIDVDPGENYLHTTMWDEGCGDITRMELLESVSRHLVNLIHTWSEDGFKPVHDQWSGRLSKETPLAHGWNLHGAKFIGIDETGNGLVTSDSLTKFHPVLETLDELRKQSAHTT